MKTQMQNALHNQGFSVVELLVAIVISMIVVAAIYSTYHTHQKSYIVQTEVATMHRHLRAAMAHMTPANIRHYYLDLPDDRRVISIEHVRPPRQEVQESFVA